MLRTVAQVIVFLTLLMVIALPFLSLHCGDDCPVCESDPQFQVVSILCGIAMSIFYAALLSVIPLLTRCGRVLSSGLTVILVRIEKSLDFGAHSFFSPLRS